MAVIDKISCLHCRGRCASASLGTKETGLWGRLKCKICEKEGPRCTKFFFGGGGGAVDILFSLDQETRWFYSILSRTFQNS